VAQPLSFDDLKWLLGQRRAREFLYANLCHRLCVAADLDLVSGTTSCVVVLPQAGHAGGHGLILSVSELGTGTEKRLPHAWHSNAYGAISCLPASV
jgi:hypothetical protein